MREARRPAPAPHVLAGEIDHHIGVRYLVGCAPRDSAAGAHVFRPPADDQNLISALQQPLDERSSDETGAAGDDDLHASGIIVQKTAPRLSGAGRQF